MSNCFNIRIFNASFPNGDVHVSTCPDRWSFRIPCRARCPHVPVLDQMIKDISRSEEPKPRQTSTWNFQWFLWAYIVSWVGMAVVVSIGDAICFKLLGTLH